MPDGFNDYILQMRQGTVSTGREFACPLCCGIAHAQAGTLPGRRADWLWLEVWCEDCGCVEKFDGVRPWPGYESLLETDAQHFVIADNLQRIRRFVGKGRQVQALRLYRLLYEVDLRTALQDIENLVKEE